MRCDKAALRIRNILQRWGAVARRSPCCEVKRSGNIEIHVD